MSLNISNRALTRYTLKDHQSAKFKCVLISILSFLPASPACSTKIIRKRYGLLIHYQSGEVGLKIKDCFIILST